MKFIFIFYRVCNNLFILCAFYSKIKSPRFLFKHEFVKNIEQNYTYFLDAWVDMEQSLMWRHVLSLLVVVGACSFHLHTQTYHH